MFLQYVQVMWVHFNAFLLYFQKHAQFCCECRYKEHNF
jgi:hypothetical protein